MLKIARHGSSDRVFLIDFEYRAGRLRSRQRPTPWANSLISIEILFPSCSDTSVQREERNMKLDMKPGEQNLGHWTLLLHPARRRTSSFTTDFTEMPTIND